MKEFFSKLTDIQKILISVIVGIVLFGIFSSVSYSVFSGGKTLPTSGGLTTSLPGVTGVVEEDANEPKTEECPLNGAMKSKKAKETWDKRIPLSVMIENHEEARPQSGLSSADVVYEVVAEGGITRFMAIFYCSLSEVQVGPVRSARTYFLDWLEEWNKPLYTHVGGANTPGPADALGQIIKYKVNDLNQFSIGFPTFWRDYQRLGHPVATEHTMYSTTNKLWDIGAKRKYFDASGSAGLTWSKGFVPFKFKDGKSGAGTQTITVNHGDSQTDYQVVWSYDSASNTYKRKNGGKDHTDLNNNKQLSPTNVVIQYEKESNANDGYPGNVHLLYGTVGSGKALFFMNGAVVEGKWTKPSRTSRSKYTDAKGNEIEFSRGQIWIEIVPEGSKVSY